MAQTESITARLAVLGGGPGGYTAAFRAADLGLETVLIEREDRLGGVCLNVGCIPSKTLLHAAEVIREAEAARAWGVTFSEPEIDLDGLRRHKDSVVDGLTSGLKKLAKARKVRVVQGFGTFSDDHTIEVSGMNSGGIIAGPVTRIHFEQAIIAAGSTPVRIPGFDYSDPRIWDSTAALNIDRIPRRLLVIGGGIIGLEMAAVYHALGSEITIVEMVDQLIPQADADAVRPLMQILKRRYSGVYTAARVTGAEQGKDSVTVFLEGSKAPASLEVDAVLVAVGRKPASGGLGIEALGIERDERGFIPVDSRMCTALPHIFAVGDVAGNPMLAHKAVYEGKIAAEAASGLPSAFTAMTIPSVAYTDPEVAWMGLTEKEATLKSVPYEKAVFPWSASGRALSSGSAKGLTKVLFDPGTGRVLGAAVTGRNAGELIAEAVLAMEMGADAEDIGRTVHAHPTLSETFAGAAEMHHGSITDLLPSPRR